MKISIRFEDTKKGTCEIPLTSKQLRDLYDMTYMVNPRDWDANKLDNKINKKLAHAVHDILDEGIVYEYREKGKTTRCKKPHYVEKKPEWRIEKKC